MTYHIARDKSRDETWLFTHQPSLSNDGVWFNTRGRSCHITDAMPMLFPGLELAQGECRAVELEWTRERLTP